MKEKQTNPISKKYIMFIDDNPADYHMLLESLRHIDFEAQVEWIDDGKDAMTHLRGIKNPPELIILDINLPHVNGHTILRYLKSDSEKKKTPVIMFSSSDRQSDIDSAYAGHANGYVRKPDKLADYIRFAELVRSFWLNTASLPTVRYNLA